MKRFKLLMLMLLPMLAPVKGMRRRSSQSTQLLQPTNANKDPRSQPAYSDSGATSEPCERSPCCRTEGAATFSEFSPVTGDAIRNLIANAPQDLTLTDTPRVMAIDVEPMCVKTDELVELRITMVDQSGQFGAGEGFDHIISDWLDRTDWDNKRTCNFNSIINTFRQDNKEKLLKDLQEMHTREYVSDAESIKLKSFITDEKEVNHKKVSFVGTTVLNPGRREPHDLARLFVKKFGRSREQIKQELQLLKPEVVVGWGMDHNHDTKLLEELDPTPPIIDVASAYPKKGGKVPGLQETSLEYLNWRIQCTNEKLYKGPVDPADRLSTGAPLCEASEQPSELFQDSMEISQLTNENEAPVTQSNANSKDQLKFNANVKDQRGHSSIEDAQAALLLFLRLIPQDEPVETTNKLCADVGPFSIREVSSVREVSEDFADDLLKDLFQTRPGKLEEWEDRWSTKLKTFFVNLFPNSALMKSTEADINNPINEAMGIFEGIRTEQQWLNSNQTPVLLTLKHHFSIFIVDRWKNVMEKRINLMVHGSQHSSKRLTFGGTPYNERTHKIASELFMAAESINKKSQQWRLQREDVAVEDIVVKYGWLLECNQWQLHLETVRDELWDFKHETTLSNVLNDLQALEYVAEVLQNLLMTMTRACGRQSNLLGQSQVLWLAERLTRQILTHELDKLPGTVEMWRRLKNKLRQQELASNMTPTRQATQMAPLGKGDLVEVLEDFKSNGKTKTTLKAGLRGVIDRIDEDGDASIKWVGIEQRKWVLKRNFYKLKKIQEPDRSI